MYPRIFILSLCIGIISLFTACGKKAPPSAPQNTFNVSVANLRGEWIGENLFLIGELRGVPKGKKAKSLIQGGRVYYGKYPMDNPPCDDCPISYQGYDDYGPEVIIDNGFSCRMTEEFKKGQITFYKVHLIGPNGSIGPPSDRVRVVEK